ncbi:NADH-cytochrome b5 reductase [Arthroderma uncinatum]|uniref:NADH-cytochrome b5 reductase n=1 Tax=Arthroderma uncinatum TaxID=74035 RepID=UPI00144A7291|nr:NADH-cytochrome b5 reductase [Arthroderma uncinatum]KAF3483673.1 NADH-cytochrome b5 reductase [Arthroderma uncinatum]
MFPRPLRLCRLPSTPRRCNLTSQLQRQRLLWARNSSTAAQQPKRPASKLWLTLAIVTIAAGGVGAYARFRGDPSSTTLDPVTFTNYQLISKTPVSSTCSIFSLRPKREGGINAEVYQDAFETGIWSVEFKQPQLQVGRDYTPLPPSAQSAQGTNTVEENDTSLQFLIRKDGEVSSYIHGLEPGSVVEMRGPQVGLELTPDVQEVLFIVGGTGIAPALQAAHTILKCMRPREETRMHILWANRRREDCLGGRSDSTSSQRSWWSNLFSMASTTEAPKETTDLEERNYVVEQLEELKRLYPKKFTVDYFVDEENTLIQKDSIMKFINSRAQHPLVGPRKKKLILISGPDGFISYLAGPKMWQNGREAQGPLRGILRELNISGWSVWKL